MLSRGFSLAQHPAKVLQQCPSSPPRPVAAPDRPGGFCTDLVQPWRAGAAGGAPQPVLTPALQVWLHWESCPGRIFWRSLIQPLASGKVNFKPTPDFSKSQGWRVHSPSGMLPQGCTTLMRKDWWGFYVLLKTSENFPPQLTCPPFGHLCSSLYLQQGDGVRKGALSPFQPPHGPPWPYTPLAHTKKLTSKSLLPVIHSSPQLQCFSPCFRKVAWNRENKGVWQDPNVSPQPSSGKKAVWTCRSDTWLWMGSDPLDHPRQLLWMWRPRYKR